MKDPIDINDLLANLLTDNSYNSYHLRCCDQENDVRHTFVMKYLEVPKILFLVLKRFVHTNVKKKGKKVSVPKKINSVVAFPMVLSMTKYIHHDDRNCDYDLVAICLHHGKSIEVGHYTALIRDSEMKDNDWQLKDGWYYADDNSVKWNAEFSNEKNQVTSNEAYILIYKLR
jgi:uncharacterized UBP type Zn finger protein